MPYFLFYTSETQQNKMTDDAYAYTYNNAFSPDISIDTCTIRTKVASVLLMLALCAPSLQRSSACVVLALTRPYNCYAYAGARAHVEVQTGLKEITRKK